ncbi:MAG: phenylalanine 4-monooxygenase [Candidatus Marinimicrobia bacterium]|nr:phenylalanine 4-monooxygenase [Candidatus Neomarinimicrobiota bacterium]
MINKIPNHLKKYIVNQKYDNYTHIDQACWKFIMNISIEFFKKNADSVYLEGIKNTGITINKIPKIETINKKIKKYGWRAVCVRGFIPPHAFMEFQSLKIMPIAADMRNHKNLTYTPAPDIVHEAAGHIPIIANKSYTKYLMEYGKIAVKAIMSNQDLNLFYAIRNLSDYKDNPDTSRYKIKKLELELEKAYKNISYTSEAALLARMNWWTVEYGLIGNVQNPQIYGAGLLSSVSESENSLTTKVKKIPITLNCIKYKYDITEQQPQLFITPNYNHLITLLKKLSKKMSYKTGGIQGIKTAIKAKTICTSEIDKNISISGVISDYIAYKKEIIFLKFSGPCQIAYKNQELKGHNIKYHKSGYSTPLGQILPFNKMINQLNQEEQKKIDLKVGSQIKLTFKKQITASGKIKKILKKDKKILIITLAKCTIKSKQNILFEPSWGNYDLICGEKITSVYGGPADRNNFYKYKTYKNDQYDQYNKNRKISNVKLNNFFKKLSILEKNKASINEIKLLYQKFKKNNFNDWLFKYEILRITKNQNKNWIKKIHNELKIKSTNDSDLARAIKRGLNLL